MASKFNIRVTMRTVQGFEPLCDFYIGTDREAAIGLFQQLEADDEVNEGAILQLDFIELMNGLPVYLNIKHCSLQQLACNCKTITKEVFKQRNLALG
ncbi:MAG TPA: hypothetical protein VL307_04455 [Chitinophagaceae bacterium]|nr:hypothetical protein [Chitinophagaceae bacterium]